MLVDLWRTAGHVRSHYKGRRKTYKVQKKKKPKKEKAKRKSQKRKRKGRKRIKPQVVASSYHSSTLTPRVERHSRSVEGSSNLKF